MRRAKWPRTSTRRPVYGKPALPKSLRGHVVETTSGEMKGYLEELPLVSRPGGQTIDKECWMGLLCDALAKSKSGKAAAQDGATVDMLMAAAKLYLRDR